MTVIRILFAAAFVYVISRAAGALIFRLLRLRLRASERAFFEFVTGAALVSSAVFVLAVCHLVYPWVFGWMGVLILAAWFRFARGRTPETPPEYPPVPFAWKVVFWVPFVIYSVLYLLTALMPEISPDGTTYHLGLVVRYYEHRGFFPLTTTMYAGLSEGIEMLFLVAFAMGKHSAAAVVHLLFLFSMTMGMLSFGRRIHAPRAGVVGALLFFIAPVVGRDATVAYIDVATTAVVFAVFYLLEIWREEEERGALIAAGVLAGFAYAAKFTAGIAAVYGLIYVLSVCCSRRVRWNRTLGMAALFSVLVLCIAAPWIVKDIIQFHNPFYPLFNTLFPNPYQYPVVEAQWRNYLEHMNGVDWAHIPYQVAIGGRLDGIIGPVFLLAPLALLCVRTRAGWRLLVVFLVFLLPYFGNIGARFLILPLPFVAMAMALGMFSIPRVGSGLALAVLLVHAIASWPFFIHHWFPPNQWIIQRPDWGALTRRIPEEKYLEEHWRDYRAGLLLDRYVPRGEKVFSPALGQMSYQHREVLGTFDSAEGRHVWETYMTAFEPVRAATWTREFAFGTVKTHRIRLLTDSAQDNDFCINEVRFYKGGVELPRDPAWRLRASSNPWGIQQAFDNSPVSWWTAGVKVRPGLWISVDFGHPVEIDRMTVLQIVDQRWTKMHLEIALDGLWRNSQARETGTEHPPRPSLRMEVRDELKAMGIHWMLIQDGLQGSEDLNKYAPYWGVTQVGEANGYRLWRLD